jgi:hypothetical protein
VGGVVTGAPADRVPAVGGAERPRELELDDGEEAGRAQSPLPWGPLTFTAAFDG